MKRTHISVVSHGQGDLVKQLFRDVDRVCKSGNVCVSLTLNIPEKLSFSPSDFSFPISILENVHARGFSANHNAAFRHGLRQYPCEFFCVINPDVNMREDVFAALVRELELDRNIGVIGPAVINGEGHVENSARKLPTPLRILRKLLFGERSDYRVSSDMLYPEWIAGMFMLFRSAVFDEIRGFDERFFLYYEDVNIGCRLRLAGYHVALCGKVSVIHAARRASHKEIRYLKWHVGSMLRFFLSPTFFRCRWRRP